MTDDAIQRWRPVDPVALALEDLAQVADLALERRLKAVEDAGDAVGRAKGETVDKAPRSQGRTKSHETAVQRNERDLSEAQCAIERQRKDLIEVERKLVQLQGEKDLLTQERKHLEATVSKEIDLCGLPPFWIFRWENPEYRKNSERLSQREQRIADQSTDIHRRQKNIDAQSQTWQEKRNQCETAMAATRAEIARLGQERIAARNAARTAFRERMARAKAHRDSELADATAEFHADWELGLSALKAACVAARGRQPRLDRLNDGGPPEPTSVPDYLCIGRRQIAFQSWSTSIPLTVPFPLPQLLLHDTDRISLQAILMHMLVACPPSALAILVADPLGMGQGVRELLPLLGNRLPFIGEKVLTTADEIENLLAIEFRRLEEIVQYRLANRHDDLKAYNDAHPESPLSYRTLVLLDFPEQMTDKSLGYLRRLTDLGPRCGLSTIVTFKTSPSRREPEVLNEWLARATSLDEMLDREWHMPLETRNIITDYDAELLSPTLKDLADRFEQISLRQGSLEELLEQTAPWTCSSAAGLEIPLGWSDAGVAAMPLGRGTSQHVLIAGKSGSGKSNLIHVMLASACSRYAPTELRVGLLDFKQGVEFTRYSEPALPHALLVSVDTDRELGVHVLGDYRRLCEQRGELFRREGIASFNDYRDRGESMPRHIVLIDEFQVLFEKEDALAQEASALLDYLARQGRAFGVHLLLATQTLRGIQQHVRALSANLGVRVALACNDEDSRLILAADNAAAKKLFSPPEAVLNTAHGELSGNLVLSVPFAAPASLDKHQGELRDLAIREGWDERPFLHNGRALASFPDALPANCGLLLGERLGLGGYESLPADQELRGNLLLVGQNPAALEGTAISIITSLRASGSIDICHFLDFGGSSSYLETVVDRQHDRLDDLLDQLDAIEHSGRPTLVVLAGMEHATGLGATGFGVSKDPDAALWERLADRLLESLGGPFRILAITSSWRVFARRVDTRKFLPAFDLRIANGLSGDDAATLMGKKTPAVTAERGLFVDCSRDFEVRFRPFALPKNNA